MALFRSPTVAWLGDLYTPDQRSTANGLINLMGGVGGLLAFFGGGYLFNTFGRSAPFLAGAIVLITAAAVAVLLVKEPSQIEVEESEERGVFTNLRVVFRDPDHSGLFVLVGILLWFMAFNALETALSSFAVFTLGMTPGNASFAAGSVTISFILFAIPAGVLGTRLGRRRAILLGLTGLVAVLLLGFFIIQEPITFVIVLVLAGFFWATVNVNSLPLVYDYGDERRIGAYTGLYYFASQSAAILGPTLGGALVDLLNDQFRWIWLFSFVFMALAWLVMIRVKDRRPVSTSSLAAAK
jgi:MFS family permease